MDRPFVPPAADGNIVNLTIFDGVDELLFRFCAISTIGGMPLLFWLRLLFGTSLFDKLARVLEKLALPPLEVLGLARSSSEEAVAIEGDNRFPLLSFFASVALGTNSTSELSESPSFSGESLRSLRSMTSVLLAEDFDEGVFDEVFLPSEEAARPCAFRGRRLRLLVAGSESSSILVVLFLF